MYRNKVIHLDDHILYSSAAQKLVKKDFYMLYYLCFHDTGKALQYVANTLDDKEPINLIITDFNHPGLNGYGFARQIRHMERYTGVRTPILLLSMALDTHALIQQGLKEKVFDYYLPKSAEAVEISRIIHQTLK
jgi:response regulator RpfG family c-di-GMP phosphodiesterase